jgi:hypothetical protein
VVNSGGSGLGWGWGQDKVDVLPKKGEGEGEGWRDLREMSSGGSATDMLVDIERQTCHVIRGQGW